MADDTLLQKIGPPLVTTLITFGLTSLSGFIWQLNTDITRLHSKIMVMEERQMTLRQQLKCNLQDEPHPLCARLDRLENFMGAVHTERKSPP